MVAIAIQVKPLTDAGGLIPATAGTAKGLAGIIVEGRMADPKRPDEVVVDQNLRRRYGLDIGKTMTISQHGTPEEIAQLPPGLLPRGVDPNFEQKLPRRRHREVDRQPGELDPVRRLLRKYGGRLAGFTNQFLTLRNGTADIPKLRADMQRIVGHDVNVESVEQLDGIPKIRNILPRRGIRTAVRVLARRARRRRRADRPGAGAGR